MYVRDPSTAHVMRRAATGPAALMKRNAVLPFVPDKGSLGVYVPFRRTGNFGAVTLQQGAKVAYTGASAGALITGGSTVASAVAAGAAGGSFVPIIGTAIGAIVALVLSGAFSHRVDPEVGNFNNAIALYQSQGASGILNIADKYLVLAGLFDLEPNQVKNNFSPYQHYGRMGEQRFIQDMCNLIYSAAQSGQITANDTVESVFANVVNPWIQQMGSWGPNNANYGMMQAIMLGLIAEYITGLWKQRWFARSGDMPNWQIQPFNLPQVQQAAPMLPASTASATPSPMPVAPSAVNSELASYQAGKIPAQGTQVSYTRNTAGGFDSVPTGLTFQGQDSTTGAWILSNSAGTLMYDKGGSLIQWMRPTAATAGSGIQNPQVIGPTVLNPGNTVAQDTPGVPVVSNPSPAPIYTGGGGMIFPSPVPTSLPAQVSPIASGITQQELLIGGAAFLALILLLRRKRSAAV